MQIFLLIFIIIAPTLGDLICSSREKYLDPSFEYLNQCSSCISSFVCSSCNPGFFLYNGKCFPSCERSLVPIINSNDEIECLTSTEINIQISENLIEDYSSVSTYKSFTVYYTQDVPSFEINFWLRASLFYNSSQASEILIWTSLNAPLFTSPDDNHFLRVILSGNKLSLQGIEKEIKITFPLDIWNHVSIFLKYPTEVYPYFVKELSVLSMSDITTDFQMDYEVTPSSEFFEHKTFLFFGNLRNVSQKFDLKRLLISALTENLKYMGQMKFILDDDKYIWDLSEKSRFYDHQNMSSIPNYSKSKNHSLEINNFMNFSVDLLEIKIMIYDFDLPMRLFSIYIDDIMAYEMSLILYQNSVCINDSGTISFLKNQIIHIQILFFHTENQFILLTKKNIIHRYGKLIRFSSEEPLDFNGIFQTFGLTYSTSPSIFQNFIFLEQAHPNDQTLLENRTLRNITFTTINPSKKYCPDNSGNLYLFSKAECSIFMNCTKFGDFCSVCNEKNCEICNSRSYLFQGRCSELIYEDFNHTNHNQLDFWYKNLLNCHVYGDKLECKNLLQRCFKIFESHDKCLDYLYLENQTRIANYQEICKFCPENCTECVLRNSRLICEKCLPGLISYQGECIPSCPVNTFIDGGFCVTECIEGYMMTIQGVKQCMKCKEYNKGLILCPNYCSPGMYLHNGTCMLSTSKDCLYERKDYCYYCNYGLKSLNGICKDSTIVIISDMQNFLQIEIAFTDNNLKYKCPQSCEGCYLNIKPQKDQDQRFNFICIQKRDHNIMNEQKIIDSKVFLNYHDHNCPEYIEGLLIIYYKDMCIKVPNLHFIVLNTLSYFFETQRGLYSYRDNIHVDYIKICKNITEESILCLDKCPLNFINIDGSCEPNYDDSGQSIPGDSNTEQYHLVPDRYLYFWNEENIISIEPIYNNLKCPKSCSRCYFSGKEVYCIECKNIYMHLNENFKGCLCNSTHPYFEVTSSTCVVKCRNDLIVSGYNCVGSCLEATETLSINALMYRFKNECLLTCAIETFISINLLYSSEIVCIEQEHSLLIEGYHSLKYQENIDENWLRKIWKHGLIYLKQQMFYIFSNEKIQKALNSFEIHNETDCKYLLSTLIILIGSKNFDSKNMMNYLNLAEKIAFMYSDVYFAYKLSYFGLLFGQILQQDFSHNTARSIFGICQISKKEFWLSSLLNRENLQIQLFLKVENCTLGYNLIEFNDILILGFRLGRNRSRDECFSNLQIISNTSPLKFVTISNLTSQHPKLLDIGEMYRLHPKCNYFLKISLSHNIDEKLAIMLEDELYYPKELIETDPLVINEEGKKNFMMQIILICSIFGAVFLFWVYRFYKMKIEDAMKIKFVQMAEMDSDEEDQI